MTLCVNAQETNAIYLITGHVHDQDSRPISNVNLQQNKTGTITNSNGEYQLKIKTKQNKNKRN